MAVLQMRKISICAMKENRKKILELLQRLVFLEVHEVVDKDQVFDTMNTSTQISVYERNAVVAENALEVLGQYDEEKTSMLDSLKGKKQIGLEEHLVTTKKQQQIMSVVNDILAKQKSIDDLYSEISKCKDEIKALEPWLEMDIPMNFRGTSATGFMPGSIAGTFSQEELISRLEKVEELPDSVYGQVISSDKYQTYVVIFYMKSDVEQVEKALRELSFSKPPVMIHHEPAVSSERRKARIVENEKKIEDISNSIIEIAQEYREQIIEIAD